MPRNDKVEIWLIEDADECHNVKTGKAVPFYKFVGTTFRPAEETVKRKDAAQASLEDARSPRR